MDPLAVGLLVLTELVQFAALAFFYSRLSRKQEGHYQELRTSQEAHYKELRHEVHSAYSAQSIVELREKLANVNTNMAHLGTKENEHEETVRELRDSIRSVASSLNAHLSWAHTELGARLKEIEERLPPRSDMPPQMA